MTEEIYLFWNWRVKAVLREFRC